MRALSCVLLASLCACALAATGERTELHVHLDGAIPIETLLRVSRMRNISLPGVGVPSTVADVWKAFHSISPIWHWFDLVNGVIGGDEATLKEIATEFVARQAAEGITYTEVRYDPVRVAASAYDSKAVIGEARAVAAIRAGLRAGSEAHGVEVHQLLCAMRGRPTSACFALVDLAAEMRSGDLGGVVGIDLAGDEYHYNNSKGGVEACFAHAKLVRNLNITVHAGGVALARHKLAPLALPPRRGRSRLLCSAGSAPARSPTCNPPLQRTGSPLREYRAHKPRDQPNGARRAATPYGSLGGR